MPFTTEHFFSVFKDYNETYYPLQFIIWMISILVLSLTLLNHKNSNKLICAWLGFLWSWMGIVYHIAFFSEINKAAYLFGGFFIIQSIMFIYYGVFKNTLTFKFRYDWNGITGIILIIFSLILYPVLGYFFGHTYPSNPTFGLPCPTTIFTFGILLMNVHKVPVPLLVIPLTWSVIGFFAAINFGVWEDTGLLVAGALTFILQLLRKKEPEFQSTVA